MLLTLDEGYLLTTTLPDLQHGTAPLGPLVPTGLEKVSFHSNSKEIPGLISFRMDWLDLLAVQGTLKSLLQHHSSKASILILRN